MLKVIYEHINEYLIIPIIVALTLLLIKPFLNRIFRRKDPKSQLGTWIVLYSFMIFFLSYYQNDSWLFYSFISLGSWGINLNLLIVSILILTLAYHISKFFTKLFLPAIYNRYHLDVGIQFTFNRLLHYPANPGE